MARVFSIFFASKLQARTISGKYLSLWFFIFCISGALMRISPSSIIVCPSTESFSVIPAMRIADGPISTPRRPAPKSIGTPSNLIFIIKFLLLNVNLLRDKSITLIVKLQLFFSLLFGEQRHQEIHVQGEIRSSEILPVNLCRLFV